MIAQLDADFLRARPRKAWTRLVAYALFEGRPATTRGRWINPAVMAGHALWGRLPLAPRLPAPIFILGQGRSGTTLLGRILALHPDVGFLNEPKALWQAALGDDDLIGSYSPRIGRYRMDGADATPRRVARLARSYRVFAALSGARRVVDKYPELIFRDGFLRAAFPDARRIVILRDGWQTAASVAAWSARHGDDRADWWGVDDRKWRALCVQVVRPDPELAPLVPALPALSGQADRAAVEWVATAHAAARLRAACGPETLFLWHESLVARPAETVARLLAHCDLPPDPVTQDYAARIVSCPPARPAPALHPAVAAAMRRAEAALAAAGLAHP